MKASNISMIVTPQPGLWLAGFLCITLALPVLAVGQEVRNFAVGSHIVEWSATDAAGNTGTANQSVIVQDTTAPVVTAPPDQSVDATAPTMAVSLGTGTATDIVDLTLTPVPDNLGPFPAGVTTITWSATDTAGNTGTATQTVTVNDAPPTILLVGNPARTLNIGTVYTDAGATASDIVDGDLTASIVTTHLPIDTSIAGGPFIVTYNITDSAGNAAKVTRTVTVVDNGNRLLYTGREHDVETGLYYYRARYYDPEIGRFLTEDPIGFRGGINHYVYVGNNPLRFNDPSGLFQVDPDTAKRFPKATKYILDKLSVNDKAYGAFQEYGQANKEAVDHAYTAGNLPVVVGRNLKNAYGSFTPNTNSEQISINNKLLQAYENEVPGSEVLLEATIGHETTHYFDDQDGEDYTLNGGEEGDLYEIKVYGSVIGSLSQAAAYVIDRVNSK